MGMASQLLESFFFFTPPKGEGFVDVEGPRKDCFEEVETVVRDSRGSAAYTVSFRELVSARSRV